MLSDKLLVGIDVGSDTLKGVVGEINENNKIEIISAAEEKSEGFMQGTVVSIEKSVSSVVKLVDKLEKMAAKHIADVYVGIAGGHIKGINGSGTIVIPEEREIIKEDIDMVLRYATAVTIPADSEILHILPLSYTVDDKKGIKDPLGLSAKKLYAEVYIITGLANSAQNILNCFNKAGLNVISLVLNPFAASLAVLSEDERELGVILLDIGATTSDLLIFTNAGLKHTQTLGFGGYNITKDISIALKLHHNIAENLKLKYGNASYQNISEKDTIDIISANGKDTMPIYYRDLCRVINARVEEILYLLKKMVDESKLYNFVYGGVVLTGGTAAMNGLDELCGEIFELPARIGKPKNIIGFDDIVNNTKYSCAVGLLLYGLNNLKSDKEENNPIDKIVKIMKGWFEEIF